MKSELSSIEVGVIVREFKQLLGAKIDKIYQLKAKDVVLQLHKPNSGKIKVRVMAPTALFATEQDFDFPEKPPNLCLQLRKYLENSRLGDVRQLKSERIIEMAFSRAGEDYFLIFELFSKGNIVLCRGDYSIIAVAERQLWSDRKIVPGSAYGFPKKKHDFYEISHVQLAGMLGSSSRDSVVKSLAMDLGLGGVYAEEVCILSSVDKLKRPQLVDEGEAKSIEGAIRRIVGMKIEPQVAYDGSDAVNVVPFGLEFYRSYGRKPFGSFSKALDYYYSHEFREPSSLDRKEAVIRRIISEQEEMIGQIERDIAENTAKADAIYHNYAVVREIIVELNKARKKFGWKEIKERLKGHAVVKEVDESAGRVVVELC